MNKNFDLKVLSDRNEKRLNLEQRTAYGMPIKMFLKRKKMDLIFDETDYSDNASMIKFNLIPTTDEADLESYSKQLEGLYTTYRGMTKEVYPDKISITIPKASDDRQVLTLKRVLASEDYDEFIRQQQIKDEKLKRDGLYFVLGETVDNQMVIKDLKKCVHLLIAGTTGSGKSVCLHTIIDSLMYQYTPNQLKFVMFDMKAVELSFYDDSPYLLEPICIKSTKACDILENLTNEMNKRYNLIHSYGEKTIEGYNSLSNTDKLPYIVVVIDEYADLILTNKLVDEKIQELAQKSRACGIHLIISTQHPKADVVTSVIKACLTTRISFRVADGNASRMILDEGGAEDLSENGDMLIKTANEVYVYNVLS
jgi:DNA segregation ATPase FtsK/SpoIIIE-like protein